MNTPNNNKWKEFLLKSGLPLEFEVKKVLDKSGFWTKNEFSYLRKNENEVLTEFSFDLDAEILIKDNLFELLVECKYRDESTNWLFIPEEYNDSTRGIGTTDFLNTNAFFYTKKYFDLHYTMLNIIKVAPLCSKGIEITTTGNNPKSIDQAIAQLSYGIVDKVILAMERQLSDDDYFHLIYHHVPIVITTANLFKLKKNTSINSIKNASQISDLATAYDILLIEPSSSLDLKNYAYKKLNDFEEKYSKKYLNERLDKKFKERGRDFEYYKNEISGFPNGILIVNHALISKALKKLLLAFNEIAQPSQNLKNQLSKLSHDISAVINNI
ncbi:hypothetical protein HDF24_05940 [Mucilaginibacter sp. X4EP1]|uniref:hypothetical protein n=1 Tax=Mucilaginibacter sp. X4EP1 TaxID=2723092 RepID=UPI0021681530|nr:hypothetical protein [Mucilaginibacter sp. X4EP1]MCS3814361.1 hypothetical protein [Mucilaginibacter sp. X4EP1]